MDFDAADGGPARDSLGFDEMLEDERRPVVASRLYERAAYAERAQVIFVLLL